jgi:hypothetical protein
MANIKISQLTAKGSNISKTDRVAIAQDTGSGTFASKYVTGEQLFFYKKYVATLKQTGTNAPVATVLENTLGGTLVWTRDTVGTYIATLSNAFPSETKTFLLVGQDNNNFYHLTRGNNSEIYLTSSDNTITIADDLLSNTTVEIRVYP